MSTRPDQTVPASFASRSGPPGPAGEWQAFASAGRPDRLPWRDSFLLGVLFTNILAMGWMVLYWVLGEPLPLVLPLGYPVASGLLFVFLLRTQHFSAYRLAQLSVFMVMPAIIQWLMGGYLHSAGIVLLGMLAPLGALLAYGRRASILWFLAYAGISVGSTLGLHYGVSGAATPASFPESRIAAFGVLIGAVLSAAAFLLMRHLIGQREQVAAELERQHALLRSEREQSEALLAALLPPYIAARLKRDSGLIADGYADVTVMFVDMVGFTRLAGSLEPRQVVGLLNHVFTRMDHLCALYGLEKIKTIGDAYMVVGGLDHQTDNYVEAMAEMALQVQGPLVLDPVLQSHAIEFHVGIATGPAVAGIIGATRFSYDIWGDTVNVASRLASDAGPGAILVDRPTRDRLMASYECGAPSEVDLKGKGPVRVFRLLGRRRPDQS